MLEKLLKEIHSNNPTADLEMIERAFKLAESSHEGQLRNSGEPYIIHPAHVAIILSEMNMDTATIVAGLLHDVIEDTDVSYEDIKNEFNEEIADLVDGVTKLKKLNYKTKKEKQAENIRKMVLAMAKDIRVVIVKFADRLHNMRTLEYMTDEKKREKALETIEIYAPLADRLGMSRIKWELEDLSLRYLDPEKYYKLLDMVNRRRSEREDLINSLMEAISRQLKKQGIEAEIQGRPKNFYSIYKKMIHKGRSFDEIYDLSAVRILVNDVKDCYGALGVVHTMYKPIPGRFKDFISMPKPNKYQSLHTTVIDDNGETFEVQIRTFDMHKTAEYGIAAHWKYKEGVTKATSFDENLTWLRQLLEWQKDLNDPNDFIETLKVDFFADEVYVFTPRGDVINLPEGSIPLDFAYRIHTDIGNTCVGAKINGRIVPLDHKLETGNIVEVITNKNAEPSMDWLNIVKSSQARTKIRQYFKVRDRDKNIELGQAMVDQEVKKQGYEPSQLLKEDWLDKARARLSIGTLDDLYASVGYGTTSPNQVVSKLVDCFVEERGQEEVKRVEDIPVQAKKRRPSSNNGVIVKGVDNVKVRFAKCCNPLPGDDITGYITIGRGVSVHRSDCVNLRNHKQDSKFIEVQWDRGDNDRYNAEIEIRASDKANVIGDIAFRIAESKIDLVNLSAKTSNDQSLYVNTVVQLHDLDELDLLLDRLKNIKNVYNAYRVKN